MHMHIFVLHNGRKSGEITRDCKLRITAAAKLASDNQDAPIYFVGGGGLSPISGAQSMCEFWRKEYPDCKNPLAVLENSNNTAANVREIAKFLAGKGNGSEAALISSAYHIRRISYFVRRNNLNIKILSAEEILQIKKYRSSFAYFVKQMTERVIIIYASLDQNQTIVGLWREYSRTKL